jgi:hypothetical protein
LHPEFGIYLATILIRIQVRSRVTRINPTESGRPEIFWVCGGASLKRFWTGSDFGPKKRLDRDFGILFFKKTLTMKC